MRRLAFLLLFVAVAAHGDPLIDRLADSAAALKAHDWAKALKISDRTIRQMMDVLGPGDAESKWFSIAVAHKALALAGLGRNEDAVWEWQMALNIYPALAKSDISSLGAPAEFLKSQSLPPTWDVPRVGVQDDKHAITPPKLRKRVEPAYTRGATAFGIKGAAVFETVIGKDGSVHGIRMLKGLEAPTLSYAAMQALRQWKFEPGKLDGQPVDVIFNLTINYKMP